MNSSLITSTRRHFHYHSFLVSRGLVQFAIISKQHKYVNSLENMHTRKKIKEIQSICFHSAVFLFSSPLCSAKNEDTRKKIQTKKKKTINRLPLLYISVFKYIHIYIYDGSLHEHTALGPVLPHDRGLVHLLSPAWQGWEGEL